MLVKCFTKWYGDFLKTLAVASKVNPIARDNLAFINNDVPKEYIEQIQTKPFILGSNPDELLEVDTSFKWSSSESGYSQMQIENYSKLVEEEMQKLIGYKLVSKEMKNGKRMNLSARNLAECTVRHDFHEKEKQTLREEGVRLVLVSQHHDASDRCRPYQGRVYSLDGSRGTTQDNNKLEYIPLEEATENHQLFGYNCRHRLIKYMNGMHVPKAINEESKETSRKKNVDETQRKLERMIREQKEKQMFALTPEERRKAIEDSKGLTEYYQKFSKANGVPYYPWRCSITMDERSVNRFSDLGLNTEEYVAKTSVESKPKVLNNNEENVKIKLEEIKIDSFPDAFLTKTEIKNTKAFVDYLNKLENPDKDVWELFSNFNKLDTIPSIIPFQIKHTGGYKLNVVHYKNSLELDSVNLIIPKVSSNLEAGIMTTIHEKSHLIDFYCRSDLNKYGMRSREKSFIDIIDNEKTHISEKVQTLFKECRERYNTIRKEHCSKYNELTAGLRWTETEKLNSKRDKEIDTLTRINFKGEECLQDIYDAIFEGELCAKGVVVYGHKLDYYREYPEKKASEIFANYCTLKLARPDLVDLLKEDKPKLCDKLDEIIINMKGKIK